MCHVAASKPMKIRTPLALLVLSTTLTNAQDAEIPLGIEAVTGIRSDYVFRGFHLASTSLDFQMEAEVALDNDTFINFGAWYLGGSDSFRETGVFLDFRRELTEKFTLGATVTYRDFQESILESGIELGTFANYQINDDWRLKSGIYYDFETTGWYGETAAEWSHPISKNSFFAVLGGLSYASDYFGRSGLNDAFLRATLTYGVSSTVSFSPYIGTSIQLDDEEADDEFYAGLLFEVIF